MHILTITSSPPGILTRRKELSGACSPSKLRGRWLKKGRVQESEHPLKERHLFQKAPTFQALTTETCASMHDF